MKSFIDFLEIDSKGGAEAGKMELRRTSVEDAHAYAKKVYASVGRDLDKEIPDFKHNYNHAKKLAGLGYTKRKDMPVISSRDIKHLQGLFMSGAIDISPPFAKTTDVKRVINGSIDLKSAKKFIENGLKINDGDDTDDKVKAVIIKQPVGKLKPIQEQIYFDKPINKQIKETRKQTINYLKSAVFVVSKDGYIIDGHHRYMSALIIDPTMKVTTLKVDIDNKFLNKVCLAYSDAIGNQRNA